MKRTFPQLVLVLAASLAALAALWIGLDSPASALAQPAAGDNGGDSKADRPTDVLLINEFDAQTPGTDVAEFIELYDGGAGNTSLNGLVLVFFNGNAANDASYYAIDLDGYSTNASGYFLGGNATVPGVQIVWPDNTLQNGQDGIGLFIGNASDFPNGTPVTNTNLIDAVVYDDFPPGVPDPELEAVLLNPGQVMTFEGPDANNTSAGRCPNGAGGARNTVTYTPLTPTPGSNNACPINYDAAIAKSGPPIIVPGSAVTYTITYQNNGMLALTGLIITDVLPAGFAYVTDTSGLPRLGTAPVVWDAGALPTNTVRSFQLVAAAPPDASGVLTNTVIIAADADDYLDNNVATHAAPAAGYDLAVSKSVDSAEVFIEPGQEAPLTYTIQVANQSAITAATTLTVTDVLPDGFVYISDDSGVTPGGAGTPADPLVWAFPGLPAATTLTFHVVVHVTDGVPASGPYQNAVSIAADPPDDQAGNNSAQDSGVFVWRLITPAEARTLPLGTPVYVRGYVNFPPGLMHNASQTRDEFMVQDTALGNAGLSVYYSGSLDKFDGFGIGEEVLVHGTTGQFNGKLQINVTSPAHAVATGEAIGLIPWPRPTGQINESSEGILVWSRGTVLTVTSLHMYIDDGSGVADIFRDTDTPGLGFGGFAPGDRAWVRGVGTQYDTSAPYDSGYEIQLRFPSDLLEYPQVLLVSPEDGAVDVPVDAVITATFNMTMTNVSPANFLLEGPAGPIVGAVSYDDATFTATFEPSADLDPATTYTATLLSTLSAFNGLTLTEDFIWSFTTATFAPPDLSTSTKASSAAGARLLPGAPVTYTITLINTGELDAQATVTDVLGAYYFVHDPLDFTKSPTGTLTWSGTVPAGGDVTLRFVVQVAELTGLPIGVSVLDNSARVDDGAGIVTTVTDPTPPWVEVHAIFLPVVLCNG